MDEQLNSELARIASGALVEDIGQGDVTSHLTIPQATKGLARFIAREEMVVCGLEAVGEVYRQLDASIKVETQAKEGALVKAGAVLAVASGAAWPLLAGERVALNLMQRMCGVATLTSRYVEAVKGTKAVILDTRKTMPGLRTLDKYAVRVGGGRNHRMRLDDMVLIKDNHIVLCGGIAEAVEKVRKGTPSLALLPGGGGDIRVVVECDTLAQVAEALAAKPERILLDNMTLEQMREAVRMSAGAIPLEASGGVSLDTVGGIAQTGVDFISVGALTHSAQAMDIGVDMELSSQS